MCFHGPETGRGPALHHTASQSEPFAAGERRQSERPRLKVFNGGRGRYNPDRYRDAGVEPDLSDLLCDPLLHMVLRRDRIGVEDVKAAVSQARAGMLQAAE